jgi:hypothetical protein
MLDVGLLSFKYACDCEEEVCFYGGMQSYAVPAIVIIKNANQDKSRFHGPFSLRYTQISWRIQEECNTTLSQVYPKF